MKEHNYKKILGRNNDMQNNLALTYLLEYGRANILNDKFYNDLIKSTEENPNSFMTLDFQKQIVKISRDMAEMSSNDLYDFIKNEVRVINKKDKER